MRLSIIAARSANNVIGYKGELPWCLPDDLRHFKKTTMGCPIIMGRKTWESLSCKPLPGRLNIVLASQPAGKSLAGVVTVTPSLATAITVASTTGASQAFVIGGYRVFDEALLVADRIYLTEIHRRCVGDVYFPEIDQAAWKEVSREDRGGHSFVVLDRLQKVSAQ